MTYKIMYEKGYSSAQAKRIIFLLVASLFIITCNSYAMNLVGTWKLLTIERQVKNGRWQLDCSSPTGFLIYAADGYMAAGINCMKDNTFIPSFENKDMTFYIGKYTINKNIVIHQVLNTSNPNLYGENLERKIIAINNNEMYLVLETKNLVRLKWERVVSK